MRAFIKALCWPVLLVGVYAANLLLLNTRFFGAKSYEIADALNNMALKLISGNLLLIAFIVLLAAGTLLRLKGTVRDVEGCMAAAIGLITEIILVIHILIVK